MHVINKDSNSVTHGSHTLHNCGEADIEYHESQSGIGLQENHKYYLTKEYGNALAILIQKTLGVKWDGKQALRTDYLVRHRRQCFYT